MGSSSSCARCGCNLSGGDDYEKREENLDRIVDRVKTITYTYGNRSCYYIKEIVKGEQDFMGNVDRILEERSYYCYDFWKVKFEEELRVKCGKVSKFYETAQFKYLERLIEEKGHSTTCNQPYKASASDEEAASLQDIDLPGEETERKPGQEDPPAESSDEDEESKDEGEGTRSFVAVLDEILDLEPTVDLVSDRDVQSRFQTCLLSCYATLQDLGRGEMEIEVLLQAMMAITRDISDIDFFFFTKTMAAACKNLLYQPTDHNEFHNFVDRFLADVIIAGESNQACLEACIAELIDRTLISNDNDLQQLVVATVRTSLWHPSKAVALVSMVRAMNLDNPIFLLKQSLHVVLSCRVPFDAFKSALEQYDLSNQHKPVPIILRERFESTAEKSLSEVLAQVAKDIDGDLLHQVEITVNGVLTSTGEDLVTAKTSFLELIAGRPSLISDFEQSGGAMTLAATVCTDYVFIIAAVKALYYCVHESNPKGYWPSIPQLVSLCILLHSDQNGVNRLLEVITGEGKSCVIAMFAAALACRGKKVDIVTSSPILAQRDAQEWSKFYEMFGLSVTHNIDTTDVLKQQAWHESEADKNRKKLYESNIVYGTVSSFSADILHHEFEMRDVLGDRKSEVAIVDEVDMLMLDEGIQFTYLSHRAAVLRHIEQVLALVWASVSQNTPLQTSNGGVLYPGVPKYIHNVVFEGIKNKQLKDSTQLLRVAAECSIVQDAALQQILNAKSTEELKVAMKQLHTKNMLKLLSHLHSYLPHRFGAYILDKSGELLLVSLVRVTGNSTNSTVQPEFSLLVMDNGIACPLYTQSHLAEGVQRVISNKCGLPLKGLTGVHENLYTIEDKQYLEGVTHYFHDTIFDALLKKLQPAKLLSLAVKYQLIEQAKVTQFNCTKHRQTKKKIMKVLYQEALQSYVDALNKDPDINLPFNIVPYFLYYINLTPLGSRNQKPEIALLLRGDGLVSPLYPDGWGSGVETVVCSADGSLYRVGPTNLFHEVIFDMINSTRLLQLAVELNLLSYKNATKFLSSESEASKRNAVETLSLDSIITLISHLEACSSHHFAVYDLNDNATSNQNRSTRELATKIQIP